MAIVLEAPDYVTKILPYEIGCPRCNDVMQLRLDFDTPFYNCEECDFILDATKQS
jgi:hypothetical protein